MDSSAGKLPTWVQKRDGSTVPFDAGKINRVLFAATEALGRPDAFIAQELTESVLHFLADEGDGRQISSDQIKETLIKVVRELGQTAIAQALTAHRRVADAQRLVGSAGRTVLGPTHDHLRTWINNGLSTAALQRRCASTVLERFSLDEVFSENVASAHRDGLLTLGGLDSPLTLAAAVSGGTTSNDSTSRFSGGRARTLGVFEVIEQARQYAGQMLALDSPERELAARGLRIGEAAAYVRELDVAARTVGLRVILNLGYPPAPDGERDLTPGPLFADQRHSETPERIAGHLDALVEQALQPPWSEALHIHWHVADRDFADEPSRRRLLRLIRAALQNGPITFVCDRPQQAVSLAEGLDRRNPANLMWAGLNLPALYQRQAAGQSGDVFLRKLESLVRLALGAGLQKREFLRRIGGAERPAFLIDRSHLCIHLVGLPDLLLAIFRNDDTAAEEPMSFVMQMLAHLRETLDREGRSHHLNCILDDVADKELEEPAGEPDARTRLTVAGRLHAACGRGLAVLPFSPDHWPEPATVLEHLLFAWKETDVNRIRVLSTVPPQRQLSVI